MKSIILTLGLAALANAQAPAKPPAKPPAGATAGTCGAVATQAGWCEGAGFDPKKLDTECVGKPALEGGNKGGKTDLVCLKTECCNAAVTCDFTQWYMKTDADTQAKTMEEVEGAPKQACMYYEECYASKNKTMSGCITKGNRVCERYQFLGADGDVVATKGVDSVYDAPSTGSCHPTTTCCGDKCCKDTETCMPFPGGPVTNGISTMLPAAANSAECKSVNPKTGQGIPPVAEDGSACVWTPTNLDTFRYDFTTQSVWKIQQNGGMMADGTAPKNYPMFCAPGILGPNKATKAVVTPLLAMLLLMTVAIAGFRRSNTGFFDKVAPLCVFLTGFFLMLSEGSTFSLLTAVVASTTMACPDNKKGYLVVGQLFFLWLLFGGNQFFFQTSQISGTPTLVNYFTLAQSTGMAELGTRCTAFYAGFFKYAGPAKAWGIAPNRVSYGLCSREFIGFEVFMAYLNAFAVFAMVAHTVHVYLAPVAGVATNDQVKTPVEMATVTVTNGV